MVTPEDPYFPKVHIRVTLTKALLPLMHTRVTGRSGSHPRVTIRVILQDRH